MSSVTRKLAGNAVRHKLSGIGPEGLPHIFRARQFRLLLLHSSETTTEKRSLRSERRGRAPNGQSSDGLDTLLRRRERYQRYTDYDEDCHTHQFVTWNDVPQCLSAHDGPMNWLDHAVKAIRLRLASGLRMAKSKKTPSVTYRPNIIDIEGLAANMING